MLVQFQCHFVDLGNVFVNPCFFIREKIAVFDCGDRLSFEEGRAETTITKAKSLT